MDREITERELRNESGAIMRRLDEGQSFIVTRNGVPVGQLLPLRRPHFTPKQDVLDAFRNAPAINLERLRDEVDAVVDQTCDGT